MYASTTYRSSNVRIPNMQISKCSDPKHTDVEMSDQSHTDLAPRMVAVQQTQAHFCRSWYKAFTLQRVRECVLTCSKLAHILPQGCARSLNISAISAAAGEGPSPLSADAKSLFQTRSFVLWLKSKRISPPSSLQQKKGSRFSRHAVDQETCR